MASIEISPLLTAPPLLGIIFNWSLLSMLTIQVYIYNLYFPKDNIKIKSLVYGLYVVEWIQTGFATSDAFHWYVYGWGRLDFLFDNHTAWFNVPIMSALISCTVQLFYSWRIWTIGRSRVVTGVIALISLAQMGAGLATGHEIHIDPSITNRNVFPATSVWLGGSALVDTLISISMIYFLTRSRTKRFGSMDNVVNRLIRLTVETGAVTATFAILELVFFVVFGDNNLHVIAGLSLSKLYSNTLLVLFNNRMVMSHRADGTVMHSIIVDDSNHSSDSGVMVVGGGRFKNHLETFVAAVPPRDVELGYVNKSDITHISNQEDD